MPGGKHAEDIGGCVSDAVSADRFITVRFQRSQKVFVKHWLQCKTQNKNNGNIHNTMWFCLCDAETCREADIFPVIILLPHTSTFQIMKMWNLFIIVIIIIDIINRIIGTGHRKVKINKFWTYFFICSPQKCANHVGETMTTAL